jgi:hypothetical protein
MLMRVFAAPNQTINRRDVPMGAVMQNRTVEGLLAYCDWLVDKGYATVAQVDPWRTATRKVFETVEGEEYASLDISGIDLADYLARFQTLAGSQYKSESIVTYGRRLRNALDAHEHYLSTGRPPTFRRGGSSPKKEGEAKPGAAAVAPAQGPAQTLSVAGPGLVEFPFPLRGGQMAQLRLPTRLDKSDVDRLSAFLRTLQAEEQPQIPRRTGEDDGQALAA